MELKTHQNSFRQRKVPIRFVNWKSSQDAIALVPIKDDGLNSLRWRQGELSVSYDRGLLR